MKESYADAGVDIDAADRAKELIKKHARSTLRPEVLSGVGFFGGLYQFQGYQQPVLVSSIDQVGTKTKIANALGKHDTVGIDIVSHCVNDIFACGALGITTEPATDFKAIARNHENCFLVGEGDNRILTRNDPDEIDAMVRSMIETAHITGGYVMSIGNHIPWNVTPEGIKRYLDRSAEWGNR